MLEIVSDRISQQSSSPVAALTAQTWLEYRTTGDSWKKLSATLESKKGTLVADRTHLDVLYKLTQEVENPQVQLVVSAKSILMPFGELLIQQGSKIVAMDLEIISISEDAIAARVPQRGMLSDLAAGASLQFAVRWLAQ